MAEQLESYTFTGGNTRKLYPWRLWLNGKPWRLVMGRDFHISLVSMRTSVYAQAKRVGLKVRTTAESDTTLVIQAIKPELEDTK